MASMLRAASLVALTVGAGAGCIAAEGDDATVTGDDSLGEVEQSVAGCGRWGCGQNGPFTDIYDVHEINEKGLPNIDGYAITEVTHVSFVGRQFAIDVKNGRLTAKTKDAGPVISLGGVGMPSANIVGLQFIMKDGSGTQYDVKVQSTSTTPFWSTMYPGTAETYRIDWKVHGIPDAYFQNMCTNPPQSSNEGEETLQMDGFEVVLFEGDRIDAGGKRVFADATTNPTNNDWFNFGCAGSALSKIYLMRHTQASAPSPLVKASLAERQTVLKMITADYCNNGFPFTVGGEPLVYRDDKGWMDFFVNPGVGALEGRWGPNGPICLEDPRLRVSASPIAAIQFPNIEASIAARCTRPKKCTAIGQTKNPFQQFGAHMVSANH